MTRRKAIKLALAALAGAAVPAAVAGEMTTLAGVAGLGRPYVIGSRLAIAQAIRFPSSPIRDALLESTRDGLRALSP